MTKEEAFKEWSAERGVWPRLTHEEIFFTAWNAAYAEGRKAGLEEAAGMAECAVVSYKDGECIVSAACNQIANAIREAGRE